MLCHSEDTGTGWRSCGWSRVSEGEPSDGISCGKLCIQMVALLRTKLSSANNMLDKNISAPHLNESFYEQLGLI